MHAQSLPRKLYVQMNRINFGRYSAMFLFMILALLSCTEAQVPEHVIVLHGKDLHLDVKKSVEFSETNDFFWKFNDNINVAKASYQTKPVIFPRYKGRAELFVQDYSFLLKNVQHSDSGVYTAVVSGERDQTVAEYKVTVQDAVSVPELTVTPVSSSSDSCNLTVTCSTEDLNSSSIFTCNAQNCYQVEEKSLKATNSFSSLIVYLEQNFIFCNHSNQVSWNQTKEELKSYCETKSSISICVMKTVVFSVVLIIMVFAVISVHLMEKLKKEK